MSSIPHAPSVRAAPAGLPAGSIARFGHKLETLIGWITEVPAAALVVADEELALEFCSIVAPDLEGAAVGREPQHPRDDGVGDVDPAVRTEGDVGGGCRRGAGRRMRRDGDGRGARARSCCSACADAGEPRRDGRRRAGRGGRQSSVAWIAGQAAMGTLAKRWSQ